MAQHSRKWPACAECLNRKKPDICSRCEAAEHFEPLHPGEAGEVIDYFGWAEDTHDACAEGHVPAHPPYKIKEG